jgi:hypothetical protein
MKAVLTLFKATFNAAMKINFPHFRGSKVAWKWIMPIILAPFLTTINMIEDEPLKALRLNL